MVVSRLVSVDDDDFDFDFASSKASSAELASLLEEVKPKPAEPAPSAAPLPENPARRPPSATSASEPLGAPPSPEGEYGPPPSAPWAWLGYAYRVLRVSTRARERAVLLERDRIDGDRVLEEAHAALGRAICDASDLRGFTLPDDWLGEVRTLRASAEAIAASRSEIAKKAHRENAMASARRESAAASLDPVAAEQERALAELDAANAERESAKGALAIAEARAREAVPSAIDEFRAAGAALEAARAAYRQSEARHAEAERGYAEARRKALLQISRVAEAEAAVEGARVEEKRQTRDLRRQQEDAQRALRDAYAALGRRVYDESFGQEHVSGAFASVKRAREASARSSLEVAHLREVAEAYDAEAFRKGKLAWYGVAGLVVCVLGAVAALA